MPKIIINGRFLNKQITGVQRFAREIVGELDSLASPGVFEIAVEKGTQNLPNYHNIKIIEIGRLHGNLWEQISLPNYVKKEKASCLSLCNSSPLRCSDYITIFDMKIKAHPNFFSKKFRIWYNYLFLKSIKRAKLIFTDSEFAKSEIVKYYPDCSINKIVVTYCGWQHMDRVPFCETVLEKYTLTKGSFYYAMGSFDPNKNFVWIAAQAKKNPNSIFAIAGSINRKVFSNKIKYEFPDNLKILGYVSDSEAKTLMRDCKAFLFPSIYEGFGIPPLEAVASGCKSIIVSDLSVMHELFLDSANYIQAEKTLDDYNRTDNFATILSRFSWRESAKKMLDALQSGLIEK